MSAKNDNPFDVNLAFLKSAARQLTESGSIDVRKGLRLVESVTGVPFVMVDGREASLDDLSGDVASEIRDLARKQRDEKADAEKQKYLDPASNPLIRTTPED
jgi:hypothetical protein